MPDFGAMTRRRQMAQRERIDKERAAAAANGDTKPKPSSSAVKSDEEAAQLLRRVANYLAPRETPPDDGGDDGGDEPDPGVDKRVKLLNEAFSGHGRAMVAAAKAKGLPLADACALVAQESPGGKNIFEIGTPPEPWDGAFVTHELVQSMINRPGYRTGCASMWGVGLVQLTWYSFVLDAERLGGAHLPFNQLSVGYGLLAKYLDKYPRNRAIAAYNAGEGGWTNGLAYADKFEAHAAEWRRRLAALDGGGGDDDDDDEPAKPWIKVEAKPAWSKGGGPYVAQYPTHYDLDPDVKKLAEKYINLPRFKGRVSANTYLLHPPPAPHERRSVDFWAWGGRGVTLDPQLHEALEDVIFDDPEHPMIWWIISNDRMWVDDGGGWRGSPAGPLDSDAPHRKHIHVTFRPQQ